VCVGLVIFRLFMFILNIIRQSSGLQSALVPRNAFIGYGERAAVGAVGEGVGLVPDHWFMSVGSTL
jgi:hypothetical protein